MTEKTRRRHASGERIFPSDLSSHKGPVGRPVAPDAPFRVFRAIAPPFGWSSRIQTVDLCCPSMAFAAKASDSITSIVVPVSRPFQRGR